MQNAKMANKSCRALYN